MPLTLGESFWVDFSRLFVADVSRHLPGMPTKPEPVIEVHRLAKLVSVASVLALSDDLESRTVAYEIATRALGVGGESTIAFARAAETILARLGNFPGRKLLYRRFRDAFTSNDAASLLLHLESIARRVENTVPDVHGHAEPLTDFQFNALETISKSPAASISAPTSAGKSFVLSLYLIRRLQQRPGDCIIFVVPTRALIQQVMHGLRADLEKSRLEQVVLRSIPMAIERSDAAGGIIYVLTQERLLTLLHSKDWDLRIDLLLVDEAQEVSEGGRGILLQAAIDEVLLRHPSVDLVFASPLASNPEYLLELFNRTDGIPYLEQQSPVSQNLILVSHSESSRLHASFSLMIDGQNVPLGERLLDDSITSGSALGRRARLAVAVTGPQGCTIVYCNGAREAERIAELLAANLPEPTELDARIEDFIRFLKDFVHVNYGLVHVIRRGVAFHYSNMPGSVRTGVEELCRENKLRFICCTSTLLQGVNLPARDIVIENPHRGKDQAMRRSDFLNLAGRAGRLLKEFHGNIWCLLPDLWDVASYRGPKVHPIEAAMAQVMSDGGSGIRAVLGNTVDPNEHEAEVTALTRIYADYLGRGRVLGLDRYRTPQNETSWKETVAAIITQPTTLPAGVFTRNYGILPRRLEALYAHLKKQADIQDWVPIAPFQRDVNLRLRKIFEVVERILQESQNDSYVHYWILAKEWIHDKPLRQIIDETLDYKSGEGEKFSERDVIYQIIQDIEKVVRFRFVKHLRAYNDVLAIVLSERGYAEQAEHLVPLSFFMECGASHPTALSLISLGLSRTTALLLKRKVVFSAVATPEECLQILKHIRFPPGFIPPFCLREIQLLTGNKVSVMNVAN